MATQGRDIDRSSGCVISYLWVLKLHVVMGRGAKNTQEVTLRTDLCLQKSLVKYPNLGDLR